MATTMGTMENATVTAPATSVVETGAAAEPEATAEGRRDLVIRIRLPFCPYACTDCQHGPLLHAGISGKARYFAALRREIESAADDFAEHRVSSVIFTGGPATTLPADDVAGIIHLVRDRFAMADDAEVVLSAIAGTISVATLATYRNAHVNRIAFERYCALPGDLIGIGAPDCSQAMLETASVLQQAGWRDSIGLTCYCDTPGHSETELYKSMADACNLGPDMLRVARNPRAMAMTTAAAEEEGAGERESSAAGRLSESASYQKAAAYLVKRGYEACPDSEGLFARTGRRWRSSLPVDPQTTDVAGFGMGEVTRIGGLAYRTTLDAELYLAHSDDVSQIATVLG